MQHESYSPGERFECIEARWEQNLVQPTIVGLCVDPIHHKFEWKYKPLPLKKQRNR